MRWRGSRGLETCGFSAGGSGDVRDGMVGQWNGGAGRPRRVATGVVRLVGFGVPQAQMSQDAADDGGVVDDGDHPQGTAALGTLTWSEPA